MEPPKEAGRRDRTRASRPDRTRTLGRPDRTRTLGRPDRIRTRTRPAAGPDTAAAHPVATAARWAAEARGSAVCTGLLLGLLLLIDAGTGRLTDWRALMWCGLAPLFLLALLPPRVRAGDGWLSVRLVRVHRVRTRELVALRWQRGINQRLLLRDAYGNRAEVDPEVFAGNPALWRRFLADARAAADSGTLVSGVGALQQLGLHIDRENAAAVFRASGLH